MFITYLGGDYIYMYLTCLNFSYIECTLNCKCLIDNIFIDS